jgi:hypothetical protein
MWRGFLAAGIVYACGHPSFDGYRPAALNMPLQQFYQQINAAAHDGKLALASVNDARVRYVRSYVARAEKQLRAAEAIPSTPAAP